MTIIELMAVDQKLDIMVEPVVAAGDVKSTKIHVEFSPEWAGYAKTAVFFTSKDVENVIEQVMTDNTCKVPHEVIEKATNLFIGVRGVISSTGAVKTSTLVKYKIEEGAPCGTGTTVPPTADVYQQLLSKTNDLDKRLSNLLAAETEDGEVKDMRYGADGVIYDTAGEAVRAQFKAITDKFAPNEIAVTLEESQIDKALYTFLYTTNGQIVSTANAQDDKGYFLIVKEVQKNDIVKLSENVVLDDQNPHSDRIIFTDKNYALTSILFFSDIENNDREFRVPNDGFMYLSAEYTNDTTDLFAIKRMVNFIQSPKTAKVGQMLVVESVDENGFPAAWKAVTPSSGGGNGGGVSQEEFEEEICKLSREIDDLKENGTGGTVVPNMEPMEDDIPKVFFTGTTPTTKAEDELPLTMEYISKSKRFLSYVTLKVQGDSSASYPQKNFNLKMFNDENRTEKLKMKFKKWTFDTYKYCLKKNWIDVLHARNVVNGRLWNEVVKSRSDYENYPVEYRESSNSGAVDGFPVKVYVNGVYQGLYTWNIRKDESMFNMDDEIGTHSALIADGSNDITLWRALPNIDGTDWTDELNDVVPDAIKTGFRNAYNFVMTATDDEFKSNIEQYFYKSSLIDYYVFIYAIQMVGGLAKSQTMFTYDAQKFLANIYDMDTTWALMWSGADFYPTNMTCPDGYMAIAGQEKSNLLYERIVNGFTDEMRERYFELRSGILSNANVINHFERFTDSIVSANLYSEEYASTTAGGVATNRPSKNTNTIQKMRQCIVERLAYCDEQFALLKAPVKATGITLSASTLSFDEKVSQTLKATLEPSDTTDVVIWTSSDNSVATVSDGVVTPVSNGNATIRATAGNVYAECSVMVQYTDYSCTGITLSTNTLTFNEKGTQTLVATVTPTNTTDEIIWASDDETIATVNNGVVTAKWSGTTIIRVTCGNYSAECMIVVSGVEFNPLDDATVYNGYMYNPDNGEMIERYQYFASSKFRLEEENYTIKVAKGRNVSIHVWDETGNFIGYVQHGNTSADGTNPTSFHVLAKPNYIYALSWWNTLVDADTIDSVTITKNNIPSPNKQESWTLSELTFVEADFGGVTDSFAEMTDATFNHAYSNVAKASHLVIAEHMGEILYSKFAVESEVFVIIWRSTDGVYTPRLCINSTPDDTNAYFAENNVVLTFN